MKMIFVLFLTTLIFTILSCVQAEHDSQSGTVHHSKLHKLLFSSFRGSTSGETQRFQQIKDESARESWSPSGKQSKEKPCCYPKVCQGQVYGCSAKDNLQYTITFYEDDPNVNFAQDISFTKGNSTTPTKFSMIFQMDSTGTIATIYEFDKEAKKCVHGKSNITFDEITGHCIPEDAFYAGEFLMGIPKGGSSFNLRSWVWKPLPTVTPDIYYERLVSSDCAPVLGITRGTDPDNQPVLISDYYFNIQTSISDPSVFNVPDYCKTSSTLLDITGEEHFNMFMARKYFGKQIRN